MSNLGETADQTWHGGAEAHGRPIPGLLLVFAEDAATCIPVPVGEAPCVIGRGLLASATIADTRMSRRHAQVHRDGEGWVVEDLGSRNGSSLDGEPLTAARSIAGPALLRTGHTLFLLLEDLRPFMQAGGLRAEGAVVGATLARAWMQLDDAAATSAVVHVTGETGSGKELAARRFHESGPRASGPFVAVNCATIPAALAERLLFGAKKGAFSGADADAEGYLAAADRGTLFLDEVEELELGVQAKLLRALETKEILALGATKPRRVDLGVVSATHGDLRDRVAEGRFRQDLFFRLGRPAVRLPALRERREDIPAIIARCLQQEGAAPAHSSLVEAAMLRPWPGNVRELLLEIREAARAARVRGASKVEVEDLPAEAGTVREVRLASVADQAAPSSPPSEADPGQPPWAPRPSRAAPDKETLVRALEASGGNVSSAARALGVHRTQLRRWLARHGLDAGS